MTLNISERYRDLGIFEKYGISIKLFYLDPFEIPLNNLDFFSLTKIIEFEIEIEIRGVDHNNAVFKN